MKTSRAFARLGHVALVAGTGLIVITAAAARPGGGGGDVPCFENDPNISSACDHWKDQTHCSEHLCPDVLHQDASPCPGVRDGTAFVTYSTMSSEQCSKYRNICIDGTCYTELTPFSQTFSCTTINGNPLCPS